MATISMMIIQFQAHRFVDQCLLENARLTNSSTQIGEGWVRMRMGMRMRMGEEWELDLWFMIKMKIDGWVCHGGTRLAPLYRFLTDGFLERYEIGFLERCHWYEIVKGDLRRPECEPAPLQPPGTYFLPFCQKFLQQAGQLLLQADMPDPYATILYQFSKSSYRSF